jgi:hypothetical protein
MPPQLADRNLLFGIVALRMHFINRDWAFARSWLFGELVPRECS